MQGVQTDTLIGTDLLGCRLERRLGSGATAVVYAALRLADDHPVAVKVLTPLAARDPVTVTLHRNEATIASGLTHPNLVPVHRYGRDRGLNVLVMERADGEPLSQRIARDGPVPWREAADIIAQVAGAVEHLRSHGVVHQDIKPENIIVADGIARLVDLGFARALSGRGIPGEAIGSPAYMAPEQITGEPVDHRADVYALGASLFHAITGEPPFDGDDPRAVLMAVLRQPIPAPRTLIPSIPPAMDMVTQWCLAKQVDHRPSTAGDLQRLLHNAIADPDDGSTVRRLRSRQRGLVVTVAVVAILALVLAAGWRWMLGGRSVPARLTPAAGMVASPP